MIHLTTRLAGHSHVLTPEEVSSGTIMIDGAPVDLQLRYHRRAGQQLAPERPGTLPESNIRTCESEGTKSEEALLSLIHSKWRCVQEKRFAHKIKRR